MPDWISFNLCSQNTEILLGLYNQALDAYETDDQGNIVNEEPTTINRFVIGFLFFNIEIFYR